MNGIGVRCSWVPPDLCGQVEAGGARSLGRTAADQASVGLERGHTFVRATENSIGPANLVSQVFICKGLSGGNLSEDWPMFSKQSSRWNVLQ